MPIDATLMLTNEGGGIWRKVDLVENSSVATSNGVFVRVSHRVWFIWSYYVFRAPSVLRSAVFAYVVFVLSAYFFRDLNSAQRYQETISRNLQYAYVTQKYDVRFILLCHVFLIWRLRSISVQLSQTSLSFLIISPTYFAIFFSLPFFSIVVRTVYFPFYSWNFILRHS